MAKIMAIMAGNFQRSNGSNISLGTSNSGSDVGNEFSISVFVGARPSITKS